MVVVERGLDVEPYSLEAALELSEDRAEVTVVALGTCSRFEVLQHLARGADRAIVVDTSIAAESEDPLLRAALLAALVRRERPDLLLTGSESRREIATGVAVAGLLGVPCLTEVQAIGRGEEGRLTVRRRRDERRSELASLPLPAVLTIRGGTNLPRHGTLRDRAQARAKPIESVDPTALGLDTGDLEQATGAHPTGIVESRSRASMIDGDATTVAAEIVLIVEERLGL